MSAKGSHPLPGNQLWVAESGSDSGPLVVLIHGSLDRASGMAKVSRSMEGSRVIRFDRRGYGKSVDHPGPYTVQGNVEDVAMILNGRHAVLVGHSFGGNVALAAAERLGDQILGVSTYETPLSWQSWWPNNTAGAAAVASDPTSAAEDFMVRLIGRARWDALPERTRDDRRREGVALQGELSDLRMNCPWDGTNIGCPVLSGSGTSGAPHHREAAIWIAANVVHGTHVTIPGAGHGAPITHPKEFVRRLVDPHLEGRSTFNVTS